MSTPAGPAIDINKRVQQYVALRDKIAEIKKEQTKVLEPYNLMLEQLNAQLLSYLDAIKVDSAATQGGSVYRTLKKSATIADAGLFRSYVIDNQEFDLVDWKANKTSVGDFIETHNVPPPGVNWATHYEVGVQRPKK